MENTELQTVFSYGKHKLSADKVADALIQKRNEWIAHNHFNQKDGQAVYNAIGELAARIESGDVDQMDYLGRIHSNTDFTNNPTDKRFLGIKIGNGVGGELGVNGLAGAMLDEMLSSTVNKDITTKAGIEDYNPASWKEAFSNKFYAGQFTGTAPLVTYFLDIDPKNNEGKRAITNRISAMADFWDLYAQNLPSDKSYAKFGGSREAFLSRIAEATQALRGGDTSKLVSLGMTPEEVASLFATGDVVDSTATSDSFEGRLLLKIAEWKRLGVPLEKIDQYVAMLRQKSGVDPTMELEIAKLNWNDYSKKTYDSNFYVKSYNISQGIPWDNKEIAFYEGHRVDGKWVPGKIKLVGEGFFLPYFNALRNWNPGAWNKNTARRIRACLHYAIKLNPEKFGKVPGTSHTYYIKELTNWNNGTAWTFDFSTDTLRHVNVYHDNNLMKLALKRWLKTNVPNYLELLELVLQMQAMMAAQLQEAALQQTEGVESERNGGILKAQSGSALLLYVNDKANKEVNDWYNKEAKETNRSVKQVKAGLGAFKEDNGDFNLRPVDYIHLAALVLDIASIPASYIPGYGTAAAGTLGLTSMATDLYADAIDPSVSKEQVWDNVKTAAGVAALGMIPGGANKIGRIWVKVKRYAPIVLAAWSAMGLANDPRVGKTWRKLLDALHSDENPDLTYDDWKNIGHVLRTIALGHNSIRGAYVGHTLGEKPNTSKSGSNYSAAKSDNDMVTIKAGNKDVKISRANWNKLEETYKRNVSDVKGTGKEAVLKEFESIVKGMPEGEAKQALLDSEGLPLKLSFLASLSDVSKPSRLKIGALDTKPASLSELLTLKDEVVSPTGNISASGKLNAWELLGPKGREFYQKYYAKNKIGFWDRFFNNNYEVANGRSYWSFGNPRAAARLAALRGMASEQPVIPGTGQTAEQTTPKEEIPGTKPAETSEEVGATELPTPKEELPTTGEESVTPKEESTTTKEEAPKEATKEETPSKTDFNKSDDITANNDVKEELSGLPDIPEKVTEATPGGDGSSGVEGRWEKVENLNLALKGQNSSGKLPRYNKNMKRSTAIGLLAQKLLESKKSGIRSRALAQKTATAAYDKAVNELNEKKSLLSLLRKRKVDTPEDKDTSSLIKTIELEVKALSSKLNKVSKLTKNKSYDEIAQELFGLKFLNGGQIQIFLEGGNLSYEDYVALYDPRNLGAGYSSLGGWNNTLRLNYAGNFIKANGHYNAGDLREAYNRNLAYTSNLDIVGQDINHYRSTNLANITDLQQFVNAYNTDAEKIRLHWTNKLNYDNVSGTEHNPLFRALFYNRSQLNNNNTPYNIGYLEDILNRQGSSTWLRRMDRYKKAWKDLTDEEKLKRVHKVGDLGWVYKENNGNIGIVSPEEIKKLNLDLSLLPKEPEGVKDPAVQVSDGIMDPTGAWLLAAKLWDLPKDKKSILQALRQLSVNPWPLARFADASATNKRILDLGNKEVTALEEFTPFIDNVRGDLGSLMAYLYAANLARSAAHRSAKNAVDLQTAYAIGAEGENTARNLEIQGRNIDNTATEQSILRVNQYAYNNVRGYDTVANNNKAKLAALYNSKLTNKMLYENIQNANRALLMSEWDYAYKKHEAYKKTLQSQALAYAYNRRKKDYLSSYSNNLQANIGKSGFTDAYNAYVLAAKRFEDLYGDRYNTELFRINGYDIAGYDPFAGVKDSSDMDWSGIEYSLPLTTSENKIQSDKSGGKISDDGPRKSRAKDDAEFGKRNRDVNKHTKEALDRVSRLKELYVKRHLK